MYDFSDGWHHTIRVEALYPANDYNARPACIAGANAAPPEDVGGADSFERFVTIMADAERDEYLDTWRWHGGPFYRHGFDISAINERIRRRA